MTVNKSKFRDPRFVRRWQAAGAWADGWYSCEGRVGRALGSLSLESLEGEIETLNWWCNHYTKYNVHWVDAVGDFLEELGLRPGQLIEFHGQFSCNHEVGGLVVREVEFEPEHSNAGIFTSDELWDLANERNLVGRCRERAVKRLEEVKIVGMFLRDWKGVVSVHLPWDEGLLAHNRGTGFQFF